MFIPWMVEFDPEMLATNFEKTTAWVGFRASALADFFL
jgi:hypothetical protein